MAEKGFSNLGDVLLPPGKVPLEFCIEPDSILKEKGWMYHKGAKAEPRKGTDGFTYEYKEGPMVFPDAIDKPSRTIVTGEGGSSPSRFKHVVKFRPTKKMREHFDLDGEEAQRVRDELGLKKTEWLRRLIPIELERLNMFPDDHTVGQSDGKRAHFMGNALVVGVPNRIGNVLKIQISSTTTMRITIPWEIFLRESEKHRMKAREETQDACMSWTGSKTVEELSEVLKKRRKSKARTNPTYDKKIEELRKIILEERDSNKKKKTGHPLNPKKGYPGGRQIIFVKPGKESQEIRKFKSKKNGREFIRQYQKNKYDMLPILVRKNKIITLKSQTIDDSDATFGEIARELAKIRRHSNDIFDEICAVLFRMAMYWADDHEVIDNVQCWSPSKELKKRINELDTKYNSNDTELVDLWNVLLICHAISLQEDVKYNDENEKVRKNDLTATALHSAGRYNCLTSLIAYSDILGCNSDRRLEIWKGTIDNLLVGIPARGLEKKLVKKRFSDILEYQLPDTKLRLELESKTYKIGVLKGMCKERGSPYTKKWVLVRCLTSLLGVKKITLEKKKISDLEDIREKNGLLKRVTEEDYIEILLPCMMWEKRVREEMTLVELKDECRKKGLKVSANKPDLIKCLLKAGFN